MNIDMMEEGRRVWSGYVLIVVEINGTGLGERNKVEMKKRTEILLVL